VRHFGQARKNRKACEMRGVCRLFIELRAPDFAERSLEPWVRCQWSADGDRDLGDAVVVEGRVGDDHRIAGEGEGAEQPGHYAPVQ